MALLASAREFSRVAADGARIQATLPDIAGEVEWFGNTRLSGAQFMRDFAFAPVGQYQVIPKKILPGARQQTFQRRGYDIVLFEAADRSDSALVWVGPHHEVTTWFGGPAPRTEVLNRIVSAVRFTDSPAGATVTADPAANLQQHTTMVLGQNDRLLLIVRDARAAAHAVPEWQGSRQGDSEIWRAPRSLSPDEAARVEGTAYEWRYIGANSSAVFEVVFHTPRGAAAARDLDSFADAVLSGLRVSWAG